MWQRFTESARKVVFYAQEEADALGHNIVADVHLLLGLVRDSHSVACRILAKLGVSPAQVQEEVAQRASRGEGLKIKDMQLAPGAKRVIDLAYDEARLLSNSYIGTEHLLVGLLRQDGLAAQALQALGVDLDRARAEMRTIQAGPRPAPAANSAGNLFIEIGHAAEVARAIATRLDRSDVAFEHVALAIVHGEGSVLARALARRGVTVADLEQAVREVYESDAKPEE